MCVCLAGREGLPSPCTQETLEQGKPGTLMNTGRTEDEDLGELLGRVQPIQSRAHRHAMAFWKPLGLDYCEISLTFKLMGVKGQWGAKTSESTNRPY